jgi:hypothetical protein
MRAVFVLVSFLVVVSPVFGITDGGVVAYTMEDYISYALGILLILTGGGILYTALK